VPSENLTVNDFAVQSGTYAGASSIELVDASETMQLYSASKNSSEDKSVDFKAGAFLRTSVALGLKLGAADFSVEVASLEGHAGYHDYFESSQGWLADASVSYGTNHTLTRSLALTGAWERQKIFEGEKEPRFLNKAVGARFVPNNVGYALVKSATADLYALRDMRTGSLVAYQVLPNPDIPEDWNIITFPIDPNYTKQGTLDGMVGLVADGDYATAIAGDRGSYFRPVEAYALKARIERQNQRLSGHYNSFDASSLGQTDADLQDGDTKAAGSLLEKQLTTDFAEGNAKRSMVNTYVWTASGGFFAEEEQFSSVRQESLGGFYSSRLVKGAYADLAVTVAGIGFFTEADGLKGNSLNVTVARSTQTSASFGMNVNVVGEGFLKQYEFDQNGVQQYLANDCPGKVDAYRFMSFYLAPERDNFSTFFETVVDRDWLNGTGNYAGSYDPNARAMREARYRENEVWRVMHRVTYVSRVPELFETTPRETAAPAAQLPYNLLGNIVLVRRIDELAAASARSGAPGSALILLGDTLQKLVDKVDPLWARAPWWKDLPDLNRGLLRDDIRTYLKDYFVLNPPISTHPTFTHGSDLVTGNITALSARNNYFALDPSIRDRSPTLPQVAARADVNSSSAIVNLHAQILDDGRGGTSADRLQLAWSLVSGPGQVSFASPHALETEALFSDGGSYVVQLEADTGYGDQKAIASVSIEIAGGALRDLVVLYSFGEHDLSTIYDQSALAPALDLIAQNGSQIGQPQPGALQLAEHSLLRTAGAADRLVTAISHSNEITIEAWLTPASADQPGLARIVTCSNGPATRNFVLGQRGGHYYAALRTNVDGTIAEQALVAGQVTPGAATHVVFTRAAGGPARLYINGSPAGERIVSGTLDNWDATFALGIGDELNNDDGYDRAWAGSYDLLAIYSRALSADQVQRNYTDPANVYTTPRVAFQTPMITAMTNTPITLEGHVVSNETGTPSRLEWRQVGGPEEVKLATPNQPTISVALPTHGVYNFWLISRGDLRTCGAALRVAAYSAPAITLTVDRQPGVVIRDQRVVALLDTAPQLAVRLTGSVNDDGLAEPGATKLSYSWEVTKMPAGQSAVVLPDSDPRTATATFTAPGRYEFAFTVDNSFAKTSLQITIDVKRRPQITIAPLAPLTLPIGQNGAASATASLNPTVDGGLGDLPDILSYTWSAADPTVKLSSAAAGAATATFQTSGRYTLTLRADNGHMASDMPVSVLVNQLPDITILGPTAPITLPNPAILDAIVSDDGLANPILGLKWSVAAPAGASVTFTPSNASYTQARFSYSGEYTLQLLAGDGVQSSPPALVKVSVIPGPRKEAGLLALYTFAETNGQILGRSTSGSAPALNVPAEARVQREWRALTIVQPSNSNDKLPVISSAAGVSSIIERLVTTQALSIEVWIQPTQRTIKVNTERPASIITISEDGSARNITLGQIEDGYEVWMRTGKDDTNGKKQRLSAVGAVVVKDQAPARTHLVYTVDLSTNGDKAARLYINGAAGSNNTKSINGDLKSWDTTYKLALGNELTGDRLWPGTFYLVAIYDHALSDSDVMNNYEAGL
jgi:hypothetical protein